MVDGVVGLQTAIWVPAEAACNEVDEGFIFRLQRLLQRFAARAPSPALAADSDPGLANRIKEQLFASALLDQMLIWRPEDLHDASKLFLFILTRENRVASPELGQNAAKRPHINSKAITAAKDDLGAAIES